MMHYNTQGEIDTLFEVLSQEHGIAVTQTAIRHQYRNSVLTQNAALYLQCEHSFEILFIFNLN